MGNMQEYELIYDATGRDPLFPGDDVVVDGLLGLYLAKVRRVYYEIAVDGKVFNKVEVVKLNDPSRVRFKCEPRQVLKTFIRSGEIYAPGGAFSRIVPTAKYPDIIAFSVRVNLWVDVQFAHIESDGRWAIYDHKMELYRVHPYMCGVPLIGMVD
jgi:hypothetical protein